MTVENTATICMLARDCESALKRNIPKIEQLQCFFKQSYVIVIENDSKDNTKSILNEWSIKNKSVYIESKDINEVTIPQKVINNYMPGASRYRIEKMAGFRNQYLKFIIDHKLVTDYIIVIDIDIDDFNYKDIIMSIEQAPRDWSALFANGLLYCTLFNKVVLTKYYDTYAYVPEKSDTDELTYKEEWINADSLKKQLNKQKFVPCKSAFGGIGIYKYNSIIGSKYITKKNNRSNCQEVICEHILLNEECLKAGKNYISSVLQTYYKKLPLSLYMIISNKSFIKLYEIKKHEKFHE